MDIEEVQKRVHKTAVEHGWWIEPRSFGDVIALMHSELSEALESYRDTGGVYIYEIEDKPEGAVVELADVIIRVLDFCEWRGIDIVDALERKMAYNDTRPYRHGGKAL